MESMAFVIFQVKLWFTSSHSFRVYSPSPEKFQFWKKMKLWSVLLSNKFRLLNLRFSFFFEIIPSNLVIPWRRNGNKRASFFFSRIIKFTVQVASETTAIYVLVGASCEPIAKYAVSGYFVIYCSKLYLDVL